MAVVCVVVVCVLCVCVCVVCVYVLCVCMCVVSCVLCRVLCLCKQAGPRVTSAVSGLLVLLGYGMTCLALRFSFAYPWLLGIFYMFVGQGCWGLGIAALLTNMKNYSGPHVGKITGLLSSAFALSSGMFTLIWSGGFSPNDNVSGFILTMAIVVSCVAFVATLTMKVVYPKLPVENSDIDIREDDTEEAQQQQEYKQQQQQQQAKADDESSGVLPQQHTATTATATNIGTTAVTHAVVSENERGIDITGKDLALQFDFWLLWIAFLIGAGIGMMVINHLGDLVLSLDGTASEKNLLVGLLSLCNCAGRLFVGYVGDQFKHRINRAYWLVAVFSVFAVTHGVFFCIMEFWYVPILVALTAFSYGSMTAVVPVLIGQYWGLKHVGANYGYMALAPAVGSIVYGQVASFFYDQYSDEDADGCYGNSCYEVAFAMTSSSALVGAVLVFFLARRQSMLKLL
eukprot:TRINITY_DN2028_c3_g1_i1.p1 TRINITY_DN2028_c3_g1~~TRINITY_DN2028_c3_g1_i1.p1  ORF type:complete len:456 (-),score=64.40 TRINITY_DN2028_c3_g1_i1:49-1416(-)